MSQCVQYDQKACAHKSHGPEGHTSFLTMLAHTSPKDLTGIQAYNQACAHKSISDGPEGHTSFDCTLDMAFTSSMIYLINLPFGLNARTGTMVQKTIWTFCAHKSQPEFRLDLKGIQNEIVPRGKHDDVFKFNKWPAELRNWMRMLGTKTTIRNGRRLQ